MKASRTASFVSVTILLLLSLRLGQVSITTASGLDLLWWLGLWVFHWRRQTGLRLSLLSLALLLPGLISHGFLWLSLSAACLGLLQQRASRDDIILEQRGWDPGVWP